MDRHHRWQIRQPAALIKLRSSALGLLRLLSATITKSTTKVKPSNKRGAQHCALNVRQLVRLLAKTRPSGIDFHIKMQILATA